MLIRPKQPSSWLGAGASPIRRRSLLIGAAHERTARLDRRVRLTTKETATSNPGVRQSRPRRPSPLHSSWTTESHFAPESPPKAADAAGHSKKVADNTSCLVCHANFRKEAWLRRTPLMAVGCASCHGPSVAHRNDEANIIPPDIMFPRRVNRRLLRTVPRRP